MKHSSPILNRRQFLRSTTALGMAAYAHQLLPVFAQNAVERPVLKPDSTGAIDLVIDETEIVIGGKSALATTLNGTVPGPLVRLQEGTEAVIRVTNRLKGDSSIHWHGVILPYQMDGVPGLSYDGIQPGETFEYRFPVTQNGTYWYHSHTGLQEQTGLYGPMIIEAARREPWAYDRDYVVMLSDWTFDDPHTLLAKLKKQADYSNYQQRTLQEFIRDTRRDGFVPTMKERLMWSKMRMMPTDFADITGHYYTYLVNGRDPDSNWTGLFKPGEKVRLRFINAAAGTYFDVRIPGLPLTVVQADGQNVAPVQVDEFRIAVAETYDVIVEPKADQAYTIFAESMDRSGYARGTLAPRAGLSAAIPPRRERPTLTMKDMGMDMGDMKGMSGMDGMQGMDSMKGMTGMKAMPKSDAAMPNMDHAKMGMTPPSPPQSHGAHGAATTGMQHGSEGAAKTYKHGPDTHGPGNTTVAMVSQSRLHERGSGLEDASWKVLVYTDLKSSAPGLDQRPPRREIEMHLTGNMERYMWSFDGERFSGGTEPIRLVHGERVRLTFVNDTMMNHPVHLHGMWLVLDNGNGQHNPRKHTINVKPAERLSADVTVDAPGNWAFHCHILFHMEMGMFRVVSVSKPMKEGKGA
jgi:CopA family copper-resistance protein